jgi:ABC-type multidrug transport system ATPase subunit
MHSDFRGECIYQAEVDVHFPQLTVGQTLEFAARARGTSQICAFSRVLLTVLQHLEIEFQESPEINMLNTCGTSSWQW